MNRTEDKIREQFEELQACKQRVLDLERELGDARESIYYLQEELSECDDYLTKNGL